MTCLAKPEWEIIKQTRKILLKIFHVESKKYELSTRALNAANELDRFLEAVCDMETTGEISQVKEIVEEITKDISVVTEEITKEFDL